MNQYKKLIIYTLILLMPLSLVFVSGLQNDGVTILWAILVAIITSGLVVYAVRNFTPTAYRQAVVQKYNANNPKLLVRLAVLLCVCLGLLCLGEDDLLNSIVDALLSL